MQENDPKNNRSAVPHVPPSTTSLGGDVPVVPPQPSGSGVQQAVSANIVDKSAPGMPPPASQTASTSPAPSISPSTSPAAQAQSDPGSAKTKTIKPTRDTVFDLESRLKQAKETITRSPHFQHRSQALYQIPWFLVMGHDHDQTVDLLTSANVESPFSPPNLSDVDTPLSWSWWMFRSMVAILLGPQTMIDTQNHDQLVFWQKTIGLLHKYRRKLPLNGAILTFSAKKLLSHSELLRHESRQLRCMLDEAYRILQFRFPVYIVLTQSEDMPGYSSFFDMLPDGVSHQVFGYRKDLNPMNAQNVSAYVHEAFSSITSRLYDLRLSMLSQAKNAGERRGIFDFVERFKELEDPLSIVAEALFSENPYQYEPFWRGFYLTSAMGSKKFISDLFGHFLPVDASLAERM